MHSPSSLTQARNGLDITARQDELLAVARVRAGDALALEVIFTAYRRELCGSAERITLSTEIAEEVVQDVFLAIWTGRSHWNITTSLGAYLHRAVHNVATRAATSRTRGGASSGELTAASRSEPERFHDQAPNPEVLAERVALAEAVSAAVDDMPVRAREVFLLSRGKELTNREIAVRLGLSTKTVESHMNRAFSVLRDRLGGWRR
jgi:RNA polymerase sigma-70 factor (ECF subfamily)